MEGRGYFEITWIMRVLERAGVFAASMRACRLEPLPEIRTAMLCCVSGMVND